ncbi:MAG: LacI family DNA-binding transcriptional regulator [Propionibacteriaceae bacterium]|nr:LacI family DNA-binding transcriptional regulator [Propionibacteriaceae bacterium]
MASFVTLKRVAQEADVSVYSASRALNGLDGVSEATRARVLSIAQQLGYVPNRAAQLLRGEETRTLGILTANSANVYYARLVAGIEDVVRPRGYHTLAADAMEGEVYSAPREAEFIETMLQFRVAAVILTYRIRTQNLARLLERRIPVVFVDCTPPAEFPDLPSAMSNGEAISLEVGRHLAGHGYHHWTYLGHNIEWPTRQGRERGIAAAAKEAEVVLDIVEGSNSIEAAYRAMQDYLTTPSGRAMDALYASNEHLLIGAVRALRKAGIKISSDVGVIGFDDFDWAPAFDIPFTVVDQHTREIGRHAGALVLAEAGEEDLRTTAEMPDPTLVVRESCGCRAHA